MRIRAAGDRDGFAEPRRDARRTSSGWSSWRWSRAFWPCRDASRGDGDALTGRVKRRWRRSDRTHGEEPLGAGLVRDVRVEMPTDFWICRSMYPINPIGLGPMAADIRIQTSCIQFNLKWVKSVYIVDDPNPLLGIYTASSRLYY
jgi:hypothetical protein